MFSGLRGWIRSRWDRRKARAFPPEALTFHLPAWQQRELSGAGAEQARAFFARFAPDELLVLHGSAWRSEAGVTLVCGPPGIGKTSVLTELEACGEGRLVEDGVILVAVRCGRWELTETGTVGVMRRAARISKRVRRVLLADFSFWLERDTASARRARPFRSVLLCAWLPRLSFAAASLVVGPASPPFEPALATVGRLLLAYHAEDPWLAVRVSPRLAVEEVTDLRELVPAAVELDVISPIGGVAEVRDRLRHALSAAGQGVRATS